MGEKHAGTKRQNMSLSALAPAVAFNRLKDIKCTPSEQTCDLRESKQCAHIVLSGLGERPLPPLPWVGPSLSRRSKKPRKNTIQRGVPENYNFDRASMQAHSITNTFRADPQQRAKHGLPLASSQKCGTSYPFEQPSPFEMGMDRDLDLLDNEEAEYFDDIIFDAEDAGQALNMYRPDYIPEPTEFPTKIRPDPAPLKANVRTSSWPPILEGYSVPDRECVNVRMPALRPESIW